VNHTARALAVCLCVISAACSAPSTQTVVIDKSDCVQYTHGFGSDCFKWQQYGSFTIAVNATANACSISFEYPGDKARKYYKEDSLSYIDPDNWECRTEEVSIPTDKRLLVANMANGKLRVEYRFANGDAVAMKFTVRSRSKGYGLAQLFGN
jgi:hypothetical protein